MARSVEDMVLILCLSLPVPASLPQGTQKEPDMTSSELGGFQQCSTLGSSALHKLPKVEVP